MSNSCPFQPIRPASSFIFLAIIFPPFYFFSLQIRGLNMQNALKDKTNKKIRTSPMKKRGATESLSEKEKVITFLQDATNKTRDMNLKYDLNKCVQLLEGKENQETEDLKQVLEEVLLEKEVLFKEKCELAVELDHLRSRRSESSTEME
ncbi:hypothetical protein ENBRE01_2691 [Enteropsectra breve]|nr:hypothetical protein ENBRE01_2691 [Enteropsectra breve]